MMDAEAQSLKGRSSLKIHKGLKIYLAYNHGSYADRKMVEVFKRVMNTALAKAVNLILCDPPESSDPPAKGGSWLKTFREAVKDVSLIVVFPNLRYLDSEHYQVEFKACMEAVETGNVALIWAPLGPIDAESAGLSSYPRLPNDDRVWGYLSELDQEALWLELLKSDRFPFQFKPATPSSVNGRAFHIQRITIKEFKCISHLEISFEKSILPGGPVHCLVGVNGAGKSAVLEAICLGLLGRKAVQYGDMALARKCRNGAIAKTEILLELLDQAGEPAKVKLPLDRKAGLDESRMNGVGMDVWSTMEHMLFLGLGATRDFSERRTYGDSVSETARRHSTLFDPLEPLVDARKVFDDIDKDHLLVLLQKLLDLFQDEIKLVAFVPKKELEFKLNGTACSIHELPSGVRSLLVCFIAVIREWCRVAPEAAKSGELSDMRGLVLLDEVDLHLHPKLQRKIVPVLRENMPGIQWIMTTHSPLVLSSFDPCELTWMEDQGDESEAENKQDQPLLALSPDQIYERLMGTLAESVYVEKHRRYRSALREGRDPDPKDMLDLDLVDLLDEERFDASFPLTAQNPKAKALWDEAIRQAGGRTP